MVKVKLKRSTGGILFKLQYAALLSLVIVAVIFFRLSFKEDASIPAHYIRQHQVSTTPHQLVDFHGETVSLYSSIMPSVGFGTCCRKSASGEAIYKSTLTFLKLGGRLIDTAMAYGNHDEIGNAVRESGIPRENIWITSKISPNKLEGTRSHVKDLTLKAVNDILNELNVGSYLDLCLIHTPKRGKDYTVQIWKGLIQARNDGKIKSIGVSNFNKAEILHLESETGVLPEVNQIQYHPWMTLEWNKLVKWQQEVGIVTTAYNSLGGSKFYGYGHGWPKIITQLAQENHVTEAQFLLRWALQQDKVAVIPGATSEEHIRENLNVPQFTFDLNVLSNLDNPIGWFDAKRGPVKYKAGEAMGKAWTGDHTKHKKLKR